MKQILTKSHETGREVNALAALFYVEYLKKKGFDSDQLLKEIGLSLKLLRRPGSRISWSDYSGLLKAISVKLNFSREDFIKCGSEALNHPLLRTITYLTSKIMSLPELYETMENDRLDSPGFQMVNCIYVQVDRGIDNSMTLTLRCREGYSMSQEFLFTTLGTLQAVPTLYGLAPIEVNFEEKEDFGIYSFYCPDVENTFSRIRSFFSMIFRGKNIANQLRNAYFELNKKSKEQEEQIRILKETKLNLEMANRAKNDFVARISHELRTPLNGILGMSQLLGDQNVNSESRELVNEIDKSGHHLLDVINTILDFSRLSSNNWELREEPFSPDAVCLELQKHFTQRYHTPNISFEIDTFPLKGCNYVGDATAFHQILYNVIDNAFKFTTEGTIKLLATATENEIALTISDTGVGIPQELQNAIFDSFSQVEDYKTRAHEGTGIGLTVTKKLVELMDGTITIDSTVDAGTWFEITLPLKRHVDLIDTPSSPKLLAKLPKAKVLLAEDNRVNQIVIEKFLNNTSIELSVVENGLDAINAVSAEEFDLILMDIMMPVMSGDEATEAIRSIPSLKQIPIVALTANAMEGDRERFLSIGMNGYLAKPVSRDDLFNEIIRQLDDAKKREEVLQ